MDTGRPFKYKVVIPYAALLLLLIISVVLLLAGYSGCGEKSGLVGHWDKEGSGSSGPMPSNVTLRGNGKAVMDGRECSWKIENKHLVFMLSDSPAESRQLMCEYNVQDSRLVLANPWMIRTDKKTEMNHADIGRGAVTYRKAR